MGGNLVLDMMVAMVRRWDGSVRSEMDRQARAERDVCLRMSLQRL